LLERSGGYRFALLQQRDAPTREIKTVVTRMADQAEVLELISRHRIGMNEVANVDQISLEELIERRSVVIGGPQRCIDAIGWYESQGVDMMLVLFALRSPRIII